MLILWKRLPGRLPGDLPGPLVAVALAIAAVALFDLPVATIEVRGLIDSLRLTGLDDFGLLADLGLLGVVFAFTLIASPIPYCPAPPPWTGCTTDRAPSTTRNSSPRARATPSAASSARCP
ncbi:SulP family inorganic anion transporter [Streptomyces californicus]